MATDPTTTSTVRLTLKGSALNAYVNSKLVATTTTTTTTASNILAFSFGATTDPTTVATTADLHYFKFANNGAFALGDEWTAGIAGRITRINDRTFVPVVGTNYTFTSASYATEGTLKTSACSFHTGSIQKRFHKIEVTHEPLLTGASVGMEWWIDGNYGTATGVATSDTVTTFTIDDDGASIAVQLTLNGTATVTPIVRGVNVYWDFHRARNHSFVLDCRTGAANGMWKANPTDSIKFLFDATDRICDFDTRFTSFSGTIQSLKFINAQKSSTQQTSEGIVQIEVKET
jgi:hypothetical protein